jgi:hypothetical protein
VTRRRSPTRSLVRGAVAGLAGTAAMTGYQTAVAIGRGATVREAVAPKPPGSWEEAPAPAQVGYRFLHGVLRQDPSPARANLFTNVVHWTYGAAWGGLYGLVQDRAQGGVPMRGAVLGSVVFGSSYVILPAMRIYDPPWEYEPRTLAIDWSYHLVYGLATAFAFGSRGVCAA